MSESSNNPTLVDCPSCKTKVAWVASQEFRPFCSESCKNKDFIGWANEEKRIPGSPSYDELFSGDLEAGL